MSSLNNLDIIILVVVGISALIAWSRGLIKEVLSIVGWVLATVAVIYLLPILNPFFSKYISSGLVSGIVTALFILITFLVCWIFGTGGLVDKIRSSKLSGMDRTLGLFFGFARAFLLVILFNILVGWMIPDDQQSKVFTESKYFQLAGAFADPIENLIPQATLEKIREKAQGAQEEESAKEKSKTDELFESLAQPKIKKKDDKEPLKIKEKVESDGYNAKERQDLNKLIDAVK